jgi:hypothetical protein
LERVGRSLVLTLFQQALSQSQVRAAVLGAELRGFAELVQGFLKTLLSRQ